MAKFCTECGSELRGAATFCTSCGARQSTPDFVAKSASGAGAAGAETEVSDAETAAAGQPDTSARAPLRGASRRGWIISAAALVLIAGVCVGSLLVLSSDDPGEPAAGTTQDGVRVAEAEATTVGVGSSEPEVPAAVAQPTIPTQASASSGSSSGGSSSSEGSSSGSSSEGSSSGSSSSDGSSSTSSTSGQSAKRAVERALNRHFSEIVDGSYSSAYNNLTGSATGSSQSSWIDAQRADGLRSFDLDVAVSVSGATANAKIVKFTTRAAASGCHTWTGSWTMARVGGAWKIAKSNLSRGGC